MTIHVVLRRASRSLSFRARRFASSVSNNDNTSSLLKTLQAAETKQKGTKTRRELEAFNQKRRKGQRKKNENRPRPTVSDLLQSLEEKTTRPEATVAKRSSPNSKSSRKNRGRSAIDSFVRSSPSRHPLHNEPDSWIRSREHQRNNRHRNHQYRNPTGSLDVHSATAHNLQSQHIPRYSERNTTKRHTVPALGNSNNSKSTKSIFDAFSLPEASPAKSAAAFDSEAFDAFAALLDCFLQADRVRSDSTDDVSTGSLTQKQKDDVLCWIRRDEPLVEVELPDLNKLCRDGLIEKESSLQLTKSAVTKELDMQSTRFRKELNWDTKHVGYANDLLQELAKLSHSQYKAQAVVVIWEKMKEAGTLPQETVNTCLQASSGLVGGLLSTVRSGSQSSPENSLFQALNSLPKEQGHMKQSSLAASVPEQLATVHDLFYEPSQQSVPIRTRRLVALGYADEALELIESGMEGNIRLRAYRQVFSLYLGFGDVDSAIALLTKMKQGHELVPLEAETFVQLLASMAEQGYFCSKGSRLAADTGCYMNVTGSGLFDEIASEMTLYLDSISSASAMRLRRALRLAFHGARALDMEDNSLAPLTPSFDAAERCTLIADRVSVSTGYCVRSGATLRQIVLDKGQKTHLKDSLLKLVGNNRAKEAMASFCDWLRTREGRPFTVILDGANIGFYLQNFDQGKFNFHQIQFVVKALEEIGEYPLVILPAKYVNKKFRIALGTSTKQQRMSRNEREIVEGLEKAGMLYSVPQGCLDDYFWIAASVCDQENSTPDSAADSPRRWSGARPVVVTNDQGKDHQQIEVLEPRLFKRWYTSSIVNFSFTGFVDDVCVDPEIVFNPTDAFSREIQGNVSADGSKTWHFPVQDWQATDWFCVRIPVE